MTDYTVPLLIHGEDRPTSKTFDLKSPATGESLHKVSIATEADATAAIEAAAAAFGEWSKTLPSKRRDILLKVAEVMEQRRSEVAKVIADELGVSQDWGHFNLGITIDMIKDAAGRVSSISGMVPTPGDPSIGAMVVKEPYGVVLAIAPWNAPLILGTRSILYPIAAGCTTVFKGSEWSPKTLHSIASIFEEGGVPKGVVNFVVTDPSNAAAVTETLIAHPEVKKVNFTGSTPIGRIIAKLSGQYLKPVVLELGGKAPAIIWEDANLDIAAQQAALGSFLHSGQICMSTERIIVHKKISKDFQAKLLESVKKIFPDSFVLINAQAVEKNKKLRKDAVDKGASVLFGDLDLEESSKTRLRPVIIGKVTPEMDLYKTESFGPTVSLLEVETEEEALRIANDTEYGLSSAVFTEDLRVGLRLARGIETGAVHINNMTVHDEVALPHGGAKASGYGRFNSTVGLEEYLRTKTITWRH